MTDWKRQYKQKNKELLSSDVKIQKLQEFAEKLQRDVSSLKGNSINVFPTRYTPKKSVVDRNFIIVCIVGFSSYCSSDFGILADGQLGQQEWQNRRPSRKS